MYNTIFKTNIKFLQIGYFTSKFIQATIYQQQKHICM